MRYILGMAKRALDLNGAKRQKLELDYLRLVYAVKELRRQGKGAQGYLVVLTNEIYNTTSTWNEKYQANDTVKVLVASITEQERRDIENEINLNISGMLAGTAGEDTKGQSSAERGGAIGEHYLNELIKQYEPGVAKGINEKGFPFTISWDYLGKIDAT